MLLFFWNITFRNRRCLQQQRQVLDFVEDFRAKPKKLETHEDFGFFMFFILFLLFLFCFSFSQRFFIP